MVLYLEESWERLERGVSLNDWLKSILKAMEWQSESEKKKVGKIIAEREGSSEELIQHASNVLRIKIKYQGRMF